MKVKFGDILYVKGRIGWQTLKKEEYLLEGDYYLVTGINITDDNLIDFPSCYYVSKERYEMDEKIQLLVGDIIITKDGTIGKIGIIDHLDKPATLNSHLLLIRNLRTDILDTDYLFYLLKSNLFQKFAKVNTSGSNIPAFTQKSFMEFEYDLPEIQKQKKVASLLRSLDNKIRNNNKINDNLHQSAIAA
ncbi:restriction endonuclease subunit S [Eubacterium sp.]|uniref:restriction endonuclease subunit S n=1 Tax=Eubacterium sp. TaxID=142586 RepID=UPI0025ECB742|nr:restriction endonuclease subunit S [Eubacterium sp.]MCR5628140.1 restriction endonuclease subunit S [Eubacterium sp.]